MNNKLKANLLVYTGFWCLIIGALTAAYLDLVNWVIDFFWKILPNVFHLPEIVLPFIICLPFGLIIGILNKKLGNYPLTIGNVLNEIHTNGRIKYRDWWKNMTLGLLALGGGGDIGPEASTTVLTSGMVNWLGDRIKQAVDQNEQKFSSQLKQLWLAPLDSQKVKGSTFKSIFKNQRRYQIFILYGIVFSVIGLGWFFKHFPQEGVFGIHHPALNWDIKGLLVVIPAILLGWGFGWLFIKFGENAQQLFNKFDHPIIKGILGGILLVISALFAKDILFSGEFMIFDFARNSLALTPLFLLAIALLKAFVSNFGFALGWRGGTIFPAIYSSVACGAFLAHFLPWMPEMTITFVVAASLSIILDRPLLTAIIIGILFPIQYIVFVVIICFVTNALKKKIFRYESQ